MKESTAAWERREQQDATNRRILGISDSLRPLADAPMFAAVLERMRAKINAAGTAAQA